MEAERILNNRPLVPIRSDAKDPIALTPNDLLLLRTNINMTVPDNIAERYTKGWRQANYLARLFWSRWKKEYLSTLQLRQKWLLKKRDLTIGDVVIVVNEQLSRERWPLGVVTQCDASIDGAVRSATVRTREGTLTRDVWKLCLIEEARDQGQEKRDGNEAE